ncbi:MAG: ABC transporter ATP-binding protein [Omnitrophica WOR_2 bacterium]
MEAIEISGVSKWYGKNKLMAVDDVSFKVKKGEIFGLIGPDGAGKTSIFRILTTLLLPDKGSAIVNGMDVVKDYRKIRQSIGYMPGKFSLYQDLTVEENLNFFATVFNTTIEENYHLIEDIYKQLEPFKDRRAGKLSGGMKQKLALCCALIHEPSVLFLDEPTTGVDPISRKEFWQMLAKLRDQNITILVSTPYMDEASRCDRIGLIQKGKILAIDTPEKMIEAFPLKLYKAKSTNISSLLKDTQDYSESLYAYSFGEKIHITFKNNEINPDDLNDYLTKKGQIELILEPDKPTVEDCFIYLLRN